MRSKCRVWKKIVCLSLCSMLLVGCATEATVQEKEVIPMEAEASSSVSYNAIGGNDVMPISGFYGPYAAYYSEDGNVPPNFITDEYFQMIADAGVNMICQSSVNYNGTPELLLEMLDLCEKYGMGMFVTDSSVTNKVGKEGVQAADISNQIVNYSDHPAFCGMYLVDEPRTAYFGNGSRYLEDYKDLAQIIQHDLGMACYMNLFPIWNMEQDKEAYAKYVAECVEVLKPRMLIWDHYPFDKGKTKDDLAMYFYNMDVIRQHAVKNNIPFWSFIQAGSQWNDGQDYFESETPYYPNEGQFNWNVNTCLAYGAQGIAYFPLIQPVHFAYAGSSDNPEWDFNRNGIIGAFGNKTQWYNYAKNINTHIAAIDSVLMNSVNKGIIVCGEDAIKDTEYSTCIIESGEFQELMSVSGDAMVGCFNYAGKTALYVVNYDMEHAQKITLNLNAAHNIQMIQNAEKSYVNAKNLPLDMAAGEGVLVVIEN